MRALGAAVVGGGLAVLAGAGYVMDGWQGAVAVGGGIAGAILVAAGIVILLESLP